MKSKKKIILIVVIMLAIGFAAVTTTLVINGTGLISTHGDDFDVYFSEAILDGLDESAKIISTDGKTITFETKELKDKDETSVLEYTVINNSTQYDAKVSITCDLEENDYVTVENSLSKEIIEAKSTGTGTLTATMIKNTTEEQNIALTCTILAEAIERTSLVTDEIVTGEANTYSLYGYLVDDEENPLPNTTVVAFSDPTYTTTDENGYFYMEGLKKGSHSLYITSLSLEEVKELTKEEIAELATTSTGFTTSTLNVVFESGHKVVDTIIEKTKKYDVILDANGGALSSNTIEATKGLPLGNLPTIEREGYTFVGWFDSIKNGNKITGEELVSSDTTYTLYANWKPTLSVKSSTINTVYEDGNVSNLITYNGDGDLSVTSSNTAIATAKVSGNEVIVTPGSTSGTTTITLNASETDGYLAASTTFTVVNRIPATLKITNSSVNKKVITITYSYDGDGTVTAQSSDNKLATIASVNKNTVTVNALAIGQVKITLNASQGTNYAAASISESYTFGDTTSSNSTAFQSALTTWGTIGTATDANWYGSTTDGFESAGTYTIIETVNTNNFTGFYYKEKQSDGSYKAPQYTDITIDFDMTSTNSDDDVIGALIRFNPEATANYWSGYMLFLDNHDSSGTGIGNGAHNGLWRSNNTLFSNTFMTNGTKLVYDATTYWTRNKWQHYKIQAVGNTITVWRWDTNATGKYEVSDAARLFTYTDTTSNSIKAGTYGFWCYSQPYAQFKNFTAITGNSDSFDITIN